jgi:hypothetical protein
MHIELSCGKLKNKTTGSAAILSRSPNRETIHTMAEAEGKT